MTRKKDFYETETEEQEVKPEKEELSDSQRITRIENHLRKHHVDLDEFPCEQKDTKEMEE